MCSSDLPFVGNVDGVRLLSAGAEPAEQFLRSLDCFLYRTDPAWTEPWGRVVAEAMSCGLPVVCERRGGYTEFIEDGVDGFLFDTSAEALVILRRLRNDPALRVRVGAAARDRMLSLHSREATAERIAYYLR